MWLEPPEQTPTSQTAVVANRLPVIELLLKELG